MDDARAVYPCTIGRKGDLLHYTLFAESAQGRLEWEAKLKGAIRLREVSGKVFEVTKGLIILENDQSWRVSGKSPTGEATSSISFGTQSQRSTIFYADRDYSCC